MVESGNILSDRPRPLARAEGGFARRAQIGQLRFERRVASLFFHLPCDFFSSRLLPTRGNNNATL